MWHENNLLTKDVSTELEALTQQPSQKPPARSGEPPLMDGREAVTGNLMWDRHFRGDGRWRSVDRVGKRVRRPMFC